MRLRGAAAGLGALIGCSSSPVFFCSEDGQCEGGRCERTGYCSFPSDECESGWVYGELSAPMLVGTCVGAEPGGSTGATTVEPTTEPGGSAEATSNADTGDGTTSSVSDSTGYVDTGYTYPPPPPECYEYASVIAYCYGEEYAEYAFGRCVSIFRDYYAGDYTCIYAYEELLVCLSAVPCRELQMGACAEPLAQAQSVCEDL